MLTWVRAGRGQDSTCSGTAGPEGRSLRSSMFASATVTHTRDIWPTCRAKRVQRMAPLLPVPPYARPPSSHAHRRPLTAKEVKREYQHFVKKLTLS